MATVVGERVLKETEGLSRTHERVPAQYVALPNGEVVFRRFEADGAVTETDLGPARRLLRADFRAGRADQGEIRRRVTGRRRAGPACRRGSARAS